VNVGVDQPGKNGSIAKILHVCIGRYLLGRNYAADSLAFD
jgi:hypothetical protein